MRINCKPILLYCDGFILLTSFVLVNYLRKHQSTIDIAFEQLNKKGILSLQKIGYTQSDAFSDCVEKYYQLKDTNSVIGFCFYTEQDYNQAKKQGILPLGIWGKPNGADSSTLKVCKIVTTTFESLNLKVKWNGSADMRPMIILKE